MSMESHQTNRIRVTFWGVRGTLPVPGPHTVRYGGNTSCMTIAFGNDNLFIFDAGSGIRELSRHLIAGESRRCDAKIFITHPHWDHINALPFLAPLYIPGNRFEIHGPSNGGMGIRKLVGSQMDGVFFPITMREFGAKLSFRDLQEETLEIDGIEIKTMLLAHPGNCLGYRVNYCGTSICYVTDNELFPPDTPEHDKGYVEKLIGFVHDADMLVTDSTYTDEEYTPKIGWGHSSVSQVVDLAHRARVKALYLFHHDPEQDDRGIDAKLSTARNALEKLRSDTVCYAPAEGSAYQF